MFLVSVTSITSYCKIDYFQGRRVQVLLFFHPSRTLRHVPLLGWVGIECRILFFSFPFLLYGSVDIRRYIPSSLSIYLFPKALEKAKSPLETGEGRMGRGGWEGDILPQLIFPEQREAFSLLLESLALSYTRYKRLGHRDININMPHCVGNTGQAWCSE